MKLRIIITIITSFILLTACSKAGSNTKKMLGSWEIVKIDIGEDLTEKATKIEFFKGTENKVNHFYLYLQNGEKYEGQWKFYKNNEFFMKFHEGGMGISHEDIVFGKDYSLSDNQFSFYGTFRHFTSSDTYDDSYCTIVIKQ